MQEAICRDKNCQQGPLGWAPATDQNDFEPSARDQIHLQKVKIAISRDLWGSNTEGESLFGAHRVPAAVLSTLQAPTLVFLTHLYKIGTIIISLDR